jgi:hypothetical protein
MTATGKLYGRRVVPTFGGDASKHNPLFTQVGGAHYKEQGSDQPIELCYRRYGYDGVMASLHTKVDKYLTRKKDDKVENLQKAKHCIELMIQFTHDNEEKENGLY